MPDYSARDAKALMPFMQEGIEPKNPLDLGIPMGAQARRRRLRGGGARSERRHDRLGRDAAEQGAAPGTASKSCSHLLERTDKPIVGFGRMSYQMTPEAVEAQEAAGFPFLQGLEPTLRAMNALWFMRSGVGSGRPCRPPAPASDLSPATLDATLAQYGIALPKSRAVATAAEAAAAAEAIGFPVVLKIRSPDILHKTEAGGVVLDLRSGDAVQHAADALMAAARAAHPDARIDGFLVQEMVSGVEAIVGARNDPLYGPMLLVGAGGVLVELAKDVALRLLPVSARGDVAR